MVMNDMIGRKHSIMMSVIPSTAGFYMMATAKEWLLLHLGRFFTGIAGGIAASSVPVGTYLVHFVFVVVQILNLKKHNPS